jgi:hypothetical protein
MSKEQPNQNGETLPKTDPIIETEDLSTLVIDEKPSNVVKMETEVLHPVKESEARPEADRKLSHEKRILAFLEGRYTGDFIKLNDFLKSLYPIQKPPMPQLWTNQGAMRKLKQDLMAMKDRGEIVFSNNNHERLGDNYHVGEERRRRDYNIGDLVIEAKLAF